MRIEKKNQLRQLRRWRIRKKIRGTANRPRMAVKFTQQHIYVQFIDDACGQTLAATSTRAKGISDDPSLKANIVTAKKIGAQAAEIAKGKGIVSVVFDRAGAQFHGKVKALADAARENGLVF
ncbi:MAG TPA: 50S ribosomal protein L18 [Candidatus Paceibacterota bacterium]|nr:50S ribosomal protein L18 [Verrucomicrobiota bacterium]HRY47247.1 50S ribosomal protein L18 [Candidatus Paceibacterota bacterium]